MKYKYSINDIPPSNNRFIGRNNKWQYIKEKKEWEELIYYSCNPKPKVPINKAVVILHYFFKTKNRRDPDNYSGKFILDGLVKSGILKDDSFNNINLVLKASLDKENPRTEINIISKE